MFTKFSSKIVSAGAVITTLILGGALCGAETSGSIEKLEAAARQGDADAEFQLGKAYATGAGVPMNIAKSLELYKEAATKGEMRAQNNLGAMYKTGNGVPRNLEEAVKWFQKSAEQGNPAGEDNLGEMLLKGKGAAKDAKLALAWFKKAADQGLTSAELHLGQLYYFGDDGVPKDYKLAMPPILKAANSGNAIAENIAGVLCKIGADGKPDLKEAVRWYRAAAEAGDAKGQFNLGALYTTGDGVERSPAKAYLWLNLSSAQGETLAENMLNDYKHGMTTTEIVEGERLLRDYQTKATARPNPGK